MPDPGFNLRRSAIALTFGVALIGCASRPAAQGFADVVYTNGRIQTVSEDMEWAEAVAISGGRISAVGSGREVSELIGGGTEVIDLGGAFMMPGLIDQHVHAYFAGEEDLYFCKIADSFSLNEILAAVSACADQLPPDEWIRGGPWGSQLLDEFSREATLKLLDAAAKRRPLLLRDDAAHNVVVNSAALALIGFDGDSENPPNGEIVRDRVSGAITGLLIESAAKAAHKAIAPRSIADDAAAAAKGVSELSRFGVTTFLDASVPPRVARAYLHLDKSEGLKARAAIAMSEGVLTTYSDETLEEVVSMRNEFRSANVSPDYVKLFLDGIPPTFTASFVDPYRPTKKYGADFHGPLYYTEGELSRLVSGFDAQGVAVKIHATGDGSVRAALDAFQGARDLNGASGPKHQIAHAGFIHPDDVQRFRQLSVIVDAGPSLWFPQPINDAIVLALGEQRAGRYWPFRTLIDNGAIVALGSDWPVLPSANPLLGVESMVTRRNPVTNGEKALWREEAVTLDEAVRAATINGAVALNIESETGSIEPGKSADLVILDKNPYGVAPEYISDLKVLKTIYRGDVVFERALDPNE